MFSMDVFYVVACFAFLYLITEILKELRCINAELLNSVNMHEKEIKKFHTFYYENLLKQMPTQAFIRDILREKEESEIKIKSLISESRDQRYKRLSEAFSHPTSNKDVNNV
jgi:hypothetical protein